MSGRLFVVGTPIGNLGDLTERAAATLAAADLVAAEDTRRTGRLLAHLGVERPMLSVFEGNERERTETLLVALRGGRDVALVSDAGMPLVSDPGYRIVRACAEEGIEIVAIPGPSAVTAALAVSGLATDRFVFEGFLPKKAGERRERVRALAAEERTIVVFESPVRIAALLRSLAQELGDRRVALCRELTKLHEEVLRGTVAEVLARLGDMPPKGEIVLVVEGRADAAVPLDALLGEARALVDGGARKREAATAVARRHHANANRIYDALLDGP
jgi:16S rRNA (cytidine1402-2'-O)-methyltransferase